MHRPTRTRRLSIAAIVSLLAFVVVAAADVRSHGTWDRWNLGARRIMLVHGCVLYAYDPADATDHFPFHESYLAAGAESRPEFYIPPDWAFAGFSKSSLENVIISNGEHSTELCLKAPLWFPLLLLIIAPVSWLIARPANAAAFPVITGAKKADRAR